MATTIIAEQDLSRDLYEANSGYRQYYGQSNYVKEANEQRSAASYNSAITEAYKTAQAQKAQLNTIGYDSNTNKTLSNNLNQALFSAYDNYRNKHSVGVAETNEGIDKEINTVNTALRKQGQELGSNIAQYQEGAFDYLEYLNKQGYLNQGGQFDTYEEYLQWFEKQYPKNSDGNYVDKENNIKNPMDEAQWRADWAKNQVFKGVFNEDGTLNEDKLKVAIFSELDKDGNIVKDDKGQPVLTTNLNVKGVEMLDRLNAMSSEQYKSYASWLSKEDPDLYEWAVQRAMLGNGTNASMAMEKLGADGVYSFMERFGGLTSAETEKLFSGFDVLTERLNYDNAEDAEDISKGNIENMAKATKVITDLYQYLDLDNAMVIQTMEDGTVKERSMTDLIAYQFAQAIGITEEEAAKALGTGDYSTIKVDETQLDKAKALAISSGVISGVATAGAITTAVSAGAAGWAAGVASTLTGVGLTSAQVPVVGWIVAGVALLAAVGFGIWAGVEKKNAKVDAIGNVNKQEGELRRAFDQYAVQSASVAYELRRNALEQ